MEVAEIYQRHEDDTGDDDSADESSDESSSLGSDSDDEFQDDIIGRMNALDRNSDTGDDDDDDDDDVGIETGRFNKKYITKLVRNYRSHPDILRVQLLYSISYCILSRPLPTQDRCYGVAEGGECPPGKQDVSFLPPLGIILQFF